MHMQYYNMRYLICYLFIYIIKSYANYEKCP